MEDLENIFRNNHNSFNGEEPSDGHFERFLEKIERSRKRRIQFNTMFFFKAAVIVFFVIFSGVAGYQFHRYQVNQFRLGAISPEYQEVESYYTSNINNQLVMIKELNAAQDVIDQKVWDELDSMDSLYKQLRKELKVNPNDERVIQAMIEYYQVKDNILNKIFQQLYQVKKQKKHDYESIQI